MNNHNPDAEDVFLALAAKASRLDDVRIVRLGKPRFNFLDADDTQCASDVVNANAKAEYILETISAVGPAAPQDTEPRERDSFWEAAAKALRRKIALD
jgi:hypothetical protein